MISLQLLLIFPTLIRVTTALPANRSMCSNGRTAKHAECCVWYDVLDDIQENLFEGGQCDEVAHDALRLVFHDAIGWSPALFAQGFFGGGGADGSIMKFSDIELPFEANAGIESIVEDERPFADKYKVSYGDIFWPADPDAVGPSPDGLLPEPSDSVDSILARMADAGFSPNELVDLLASHSIGFQENVDPSIPFTPFDSTVTVLDTQFFLETLIKGTIIPGDSIHSGEAEVPIPGEFRLQSDSAIARDHRTACRWESLVLSQELMTSSFAAAMAKLAVVGQNKDALLDCSEVIPVPKFAFVAPAHLPPQIRFEDLELSCLSRSSILTADDFVFDPSHVVPIPPAFFFKFHAYLAPDADKAGYRRGGGHPKMVNVARSRRT
ncbi:fungal versatile peroxidase from pleurotus Eryngii [Mycena floridula]|nr:fungal versatile peroxidase from pleurotus Eryngii [Mycena floridula]